MQAARWERRLLSLCCILCCQAQSASLPRLPPPSRQKLLVAAPLWEDLQDQKEDTEECCVCYEPRACVRCCRTCGSRLAVCRTCSTAWSRHAGRRNTCILCRGSLALGPPLRVVSQEERLMLYFFIYSLVQYVYMIWLLRILLDLVRRNIFDS